MICRHDAAAGCECSFHHAGLLAYAKDHAAYEAFLDRIRDPSPPVLQVVSDRCTGQMTCGCQDCVRSNAARTAQTVRQPWQPRQRRAA